MGFKTGMYRKMKCLRIYYHRHRGEGLKKLTIPIILRVHLEDTEIVFKVYLNLKQRSLPLHLNQVQTSTKSPQCSANSVLTRFSRQCLTNQMTTSPCVQPNTARLFLVPIPNSMLTLSSYNWWTSSSIRWLRVWRCWTCLAWMSIRSRHSRR